MNDVRPDITEAARLAALRENVIVQGARWRGSGGGGW